MFSHEGKHRPEPGRWAEVINNPLERECVDMDVTTVPCGGETREQLASYRDKNGHPNYDDALQELLEVATE